MLSWATAAQATEYHNARTTFGEVGILDMPSARAAPDGELSFSFGDVGPEQRFNLSFQILPWLEGSFRYSHVSQAGLSQGSFDRSFGLKFRLAREGQYWPEISLGLRDFLGTGIYSGEYVVASKHVYDFDVTLGLGWGRLAQSNALPNPLGQIFSSFNTRGSATATGGTINFGQFFHGPKVGVFGGVVWHTPIENLDVLAEYSSDRYLRERLAGAVVERSPLNIGASYRFYDALSLTAGWFYGTTYGLTLTVSADPTHRLTPLRLGPDLPQATIRSDRDQVLALEGLLKGERLNPMTRGLQAWVSLPNALDSNFDNLNAALASAGGGVRSVEIVRHTLIVDANLAGAQHRGCAYYAQVVHSINPALTTVALSDMSEPSTSVSVCQVPRPLTEDDAAMREMMPASLETDASPPSADDADHKIRQDVAAQQIRVEALSVDNAALWIYYGNGRYFSESEAAGRIARVLMSDAPPSVEIFNLVSVKRGIPSRQIQLARSALERASASYGSAYELGDAVALSAPPLDNPILDKAFDSSYPRLHWDLSPALREGLFDPTKPIEVQILASLGGDVELTPNLDIEARLEANIYNDYQLNTPANSLLPHVRSDSLQYYRHGINGVAVFDGVYRTRVTRDLYAEIKAGYLESMFAGIGGQVLWRPDGGRLAIGADLYEVWQRSFDRLYGLQQYHVLTGHANLYYESPWYNLNFNLHVGRYLAGDYGATFEITRRFESGVEVGAFATFTNVPFAKFGEGSFDKGILLRIPFEWALPFYSQSSYDLVLRSLTRDGGQRLLGDDSLHDDLSSTSYGTMQQHLDEITSP